MFIYSIMKPKSKNRLIKKWVANNITELFK